MTEEHSSSSPVPARPKSTPPSVDWFLRHLVNLATYDGIEVGVTLNVGGLLVSGMLVSGEKFFAGFGADLGTGLADPKASETIRDAFASFGDIYKIDDPEKQQQARDTAAFVHLKNARFYSPGQEPLPTSGGAWWRGKLSDVAGFFLGELGTADS